MKNSICWRLTIALLIITCGSLSGALTLEQLQSENQLEATLSNKTVAYYFGSFDPLHKGHIALIETIIDDKDAEYALVHAAWGSDRYKNRAETHHRNQMLHDVFAEHPRIIVTALSPLEMQQLLTVDLPENPQERFPRVKAKFNTHWVGVLGSDTAFMVQENPQARALFMIGAKIGPKYAKATRGGYMGIPVEAFIVGIREQDDISSLNGMLDHRPIIKTIHHSEYEHISSTKVRTALKEGKDIVEYVHPAVAEYLYESEIY